MGKILDFKTKHAKKVLACDPGFSSSGGLGWAIINLNAELFGGQKNVPHIHRCGLIKPFSTDSTLNTMNDLCNQITEIWRQDSGYSLEPMVLVVELPIIYTNLHIKPSSIRDLILFSGMLTQVLRPKIIVSPTTMDWKHNQSKDKIQQQIISNLDFRSKVSLKRDLDPVALDRRHNVYDAVGLGIYGAEVFHGRKSYPAMHIKVMA